LEFYEKGDGPISAIPFAGIDPTLDHLVPKRRTMVEAMKNGCSAKCCTSLAPPCRNRELWWRALAASHIWRADSADRPSATTNRLQPIHPWSIRRKGGIFCLHHGVSGEDHATRNTGEFSNIALSPGQATEL